MTDLLQQKHNVRFPSSIKNLPNWMYGKWYAIREMGKKATSDLYYSLQKLNYAKTFLKKLPKPNGKMYDITTLLWASQNLTYWNETIALTMTLTSFLIMYFIIYLFFSSRLLFAFLRYRNVGDMFEHNFNENVNLSYFHSLPAIVHGAPCSQCSVIRIINMKFLLSVCDVWC